MHPSITASIAALGILLFVPGIASADKIGIASAVKNEVLGLQGAAPRPLAAGSEVFTNEHVRTGQASTAQLLFLDETSLSIGPLSEITLDRFVYNPGRGAGNVVLSTSRGAFRFITGSQNPTSYTVKTPVATIGVRGTIYDLYLRSVPPGIHQLEGIIILQEGSLLITPRVGPPFTFSELGKALVFFGDGTYQIVTWDSTIINVVGDVPFPLFGSHFWNDPWRYETPDNRLDLTDAINGLHQMPPPAQVLLPPPPPPRTDTGVITNSGGLTNSGALSNSINSINSINVTKPK